MSNNMMLAAQLTRYGDGMKKEKGKRGAGGDAAGCARLRTRAELFCRGHRRLSSPLTCNQTGSGGGRASPTYLDDLYIGRGVEERLVIERILGACCVKQLYLKKCRPGR